MSILSCSQERSAVIPIHRWLHLGWAQNWTVVSIAIVVVVLGSSRYTLAQKISPARAQLKTSTRTPGILQPPLMPTNVHPNFSKPRVLSTFPVVIEKNQIIPVGTAPQVSSQPGSLSTPINEAKPHLKQLPKPIRLPLPKQNSPSMSTIPTGSLDEMLVQLLFQEKALQKWCGPDHPDLVTVRSRISIVRELLAKQSPPVIAEPTPILRTTYRPDPVFVIRPESSEQDHSLTEVSKPVVDQTPLPPPEPIDEPTRETQELADKAVPLDLDPKVEKEKSAEPIVVETNIPSEKPASEEAFWGSPHFAYLAGILSALVFGLVVHFASVHFLLRRYQDQAASPIRMAIVESPTGLTLSPASQPIPGPAALESAPDDLSHSDKEESEAESFDLGMTYEEELELRHAQVQQQDEAMLKQILEDNMNLQEELQKN